MRRSGVIKIRLKERVVYDLVVEIKGEEYPLAELFHVLMLIDEDGDVVIHDNRLVSYLVELEVILANGDAEKVVGAVAGSKYYSFMSELEMSLQGKEQGMYIQ